jgi:hypothetical protein
MEMPLLRFIFILLAHVRESGEINHGWRSGFVGQRPFENRPPAAGRHALAEILSHVFAPG